MMRKSTCSRDDDHSSNHVLDVWQHHNNNSLHHDLVDIHRDSKPWTSRNNIPQWLFSAHNALTSRGKTLYILLFSLFCFAVLSFLLLNGSLFGFGQNDVFGDINRSLLWDNDYHVMNSDSAIRNKILTITSAKQNVKCHLSQGFAQNSKAGLGSNTRCNQFTIDRLNKYYEGYLFTSKNTRNSKHPLGQLLLDISRVMNASSHSPVELSIDTRAESIGGVPTNEFIDQMNKVIARGEQLGFIHSIYDASSVSLTFIKTWRIKFNMFTLVILGYHPSRTKPIHKIVSTYISHPSLHRVIFIWNNVKHPVSLSHFGFNEFEKSRIHFELAKVNSLNNRFKPRNNIETQALAVVDDDNLLDLNQLSCLFKKWQENQDVMVGAIGRLYQNGQYLSGTNDDYNIILPVKCFFHAKYLEEFASPKHERLRSYVDNQEAHCDDISLNFLIGKLSGKSHLLVSSAKPVILSKVGSLSDQGQRTALRTECSNWIWNYFDQYELKKGKLDDTVCTNTGFTRRQVMAWLT